MVPMVNPDHPERPFMVPVATNEQLDQLMDVDPPEPQSILRTPRMEGVGEDGREWEWVGVGGSGREWVGVGGSGSDHKERPFMVPVATNEQLMDVEPPESQSILRTPRMEGVGVGGGERE